MRSESQIVCERHLLSLFFHPSPLPTLREGLCFHASSPSPLLPGHAVWWTHEEMEGAWYCGGMAVSHLRNALKKKKKARSFGL